MKSAYELAMSRLEKESPTVKVTDEQKKEIAEIESLSRAKVAEKTIFLEGQITAARAQGNVSEVEQLRAQLASEVRRIETEAEEKKNAVRKR